MGNARGRSSARTPRRRGCEIVSKRLPQPADIANQEAGTERNRNITVRELLDRAAQNWNKVQGSGADGGAIRLTLGSVSGSGRGHNALTQLERSLQLRRAKLGADNLETVEAMHILGVANLEAKKFDEAESNLRQAMEGFLAKLGPNHVDTLLAMQNLAMVMNARGRYDEAEQQFKQVLPGLQAQLGPDHRETLATLGNLAHLYHVRGRDAEAEPLLQEVLSAAGQSRCRSSAHAFEHRRPGQRQTSSRSV